LHLRIFLPITCCYAAGMTELAIDREAIAHRGRRLEYFTIVWNSLEGFVGIAAGVLAGSISLVGFGIDSLIEVTSTLLGACPSIRMSRGENGTRG
jgi:predicted Co/Zn/Cd cation transporter (cation efflux family)